MITETLLSCTTHRGLTMQTLGSIQACKFKMVSLTQGISDVALARCLQFRAAFTAAAGSNAKYVLFVDDDMVWTPAQADQIVEECKKGPISGRYVAGGLENARLAATSIGNDLWYTGLGFLAMETLLLNSFIRAMPRAAWDGEVIPAVTCSGRIDDRWVSEDYALTANLGGVRLSSVEVGHVKPCVLTPSMFSHLNQAPE